MHAARARFMHSDERGGAFRVVKAASEHSHAQLVHQVGIDRSIVHTATMDILMGLAISLPVTAGVGVSVVTGVAQGVSEQQKQNADASNQTRMLKFHLDVVAEGDLDGWIVTLHDEKVWIEPKSSITRQPEHVDHHPFTGFYVAYPDSDREYTRGLVSTVSVDPPVLNWIYIDKDTLELKYASRSGSIAHHVGSYDWTTEESTNSFITFDDWEGFTAVQQENGQWVLCFDLNDDGLEAHAKGSKTAEIQLQRRVISEQEMNKWGLAGEGNIGFKKTREV